ncbi:MAG TPA: FKBP-type peptidyl-prolyl cis-trans isomerase [Acidobacteria bacterium]|nr:FKBP-type peptidyl-prolyl cis-trans isomerase [Acidobacteriota bacterium]
MRYGGPEEEVHVVDNEGSATDYCLTDQTAIHAQGRLRGVFVAGAGDGAEAATGDQLFLAYGGWLYDESQPESKGALFDASDTSGFSFKLGAGQVITGWDEGLVGMRENGERRLIIPPDLAYGDNSPGIIPPNATLLFDITLLTVTPE